MKTRSQTPKRNASKRKSASPKPVKSEPKPVKSEPKQKSVRFSDETKDKSSKRVTKKTVHQSRSNCRDTQRGHGDRRSPSPRRSFGLPDFSFPYGVQSPVLGIGHSFGAQYSMPPFGYLNYPNYNPFGFGPQQQYNGNWAASTPPYGHHQHSGKRRRESSDDDDTNNLVVSPLPIPAKRIARAKSVCTASPPTKPRGRPPKSALKATPNHTAVSGSLNEAVESSDDDDTNNLVVSPLPIPAKRIARAKSVCAASPPTKPRGRPPKSALKASPNYTADSGKLNSDVDYSLQTPVKRTSRALSTSSLANRIQTPCLKPLDRVPWMQSIPRFGVIDNGQRPNSNLDRIRASPSATVVSGALAEINDNGQRPIPNLNRIRALPSATVVSGALAKLNDNDERPIPNLNRIASSVVASPSASMSNDFLENEVGGGRDTMLQTQIRLNTEMMKRVEALEAERKTFTDQIKALQAASDKNKKESAFYKVKLAESSAECNQLKEKLAKRKPDAKVVSSANKENLNNVVQPDNASN